MKTEAASKDSSTKNSPAIDIGLSAAERLAIAEGLSRLLADTYTLYLTTHNFHWNVTGRLFNALHTMLEGQYVALWDAVDPRPGQFETPTTGCRSPRVGRCQPRRR